MALRTMGGGDMNLFRTAANIETTLQATIAIGDLVRAGTSSNYCVNSVAAQTSYTLYPVGKVVSIEKGSKVCTVEWHNVRALATLPYSTVASRSSTVVTADASNVAGSVTIAAQDNTYIWGVDTGNTTMTFLIR